MTAMKTLDEYEEIALDLYGSESHALRWIHAQKENQGTLEMSHDSMMNLLDRMHAKTSEKIAAAKLPDSVVEVKKDEPRDQSQVKSMFAGLKKK